MSRKVNIDAGGVLYEGVELSKPESVDDEVEVLSVWTEGEVWILAEIDMLFGSTSL